MTYIDLLRALYHADYDRVERDDRLIDVFPTQTREKGVELWEKWDDQDVKILRVWLPFEAEQLELFAIARGQLESLLRRNISAQLDNFEKMSVGKEVADNL